MFETKTTIRRAATLVCLVLVTAPLAADQDNDVAGEIERLIGGDVPPVLREMRDYDRLFPQIRELYESRNHEPLWLERGDLGPRARWAFDKLMRADEHGLRPGDYAFGPIDPQTMGRFQTGSRAAGMAKIDLALSLSSLRYIKDLHEGRFSPGQLDLDLDISHRTLDLAGELRAILAADDPDEAIDARAPVHRGYRLLKRELARYRKLASTDTWRPLRDDAVVHPGDSYADLDALRHRLVLAGDLAEGVGGVAGVYEGEVVEAVKRFQRRHGQAQDGVVGQQTFGRLNEPWTDRVAQIVTSLERWRWLPDAPEGTPIVVNVPAYVLRAYSFENGRPKVGFQSRVIVGKPYHRYRTPIFTGRIQYLDFRPYWNVPRSIVRAELAPKLDQPGYLEQRGYELVRSFGLDVESLPVTPENTDKVRRGLLQIRQRPGPDNALGLVKFIFPNQHNVYLHSTPAQSLFAKARRDFSHGCIRVGDPVALAEWVLRDQTDWDRAAIDRAMSAGGPTRVPVTRKIDVFIVYATAYADPETGLLFFWDDIYGLDEELARKLGNPLSERVRRMLDESGME